MKPLVLCRRDEEDERGVSPGAELRGVLHVGGYFVADSLDFVLSLELGGFNHDFSLRESLVKNSGPTRTPHSPTDAPAVILP